MADLKRKQKTFTELVRKEYGNDRTYVTRQEILKLREKYGITHPVWHKDPKWRIGRGKYKLPFADEKPVVTPKPAEIEDFSEDDALEAKVIEMSEDQDIVSGKKIPGGLIPEPEPTFVPFGPYDDVYEILKSRIFFPIFLTGPTRSGKTLIPIQVCSVLKRNLYRVNVTIETDESDLLGGYRLIDGNTRWEDGPVIKAMEDTAGGILLLDEIDLASDKIMCLQPIYEGSGIYLKKENRWVYPQPGFTIVATANTKGRGSEDGRYIGTHVLNDALLERLTAATYEQDYPDKTTEIRILQNNLKQFGITDSKFPEPLAQWAENIRKTYKEGGCDETITTGRLIHIVKAYSIFDRNRLKAVKLAVARFDINTQTAFLDMYTKIDATAKNGPDNVSEKKVQKVRRPF